MKIVIIGIFILLIGILLINLIQEVWKQKKQLQRPYNSYRQWDELINLTQDTSVAGRLIYKERVKNPNQSLEWCLNQALYNLKQNKF